MDIIPQRPCSKCGECFPYTSEYFVIQKQNKDGLSGYCKSCNRERSRLSYQANRDKIADRRKQHRVENPRRYGGTVYKAEYYQKNKERLLAQNREYRRRNPEKVRMMLRESRHRRRAIELAAEGSHTKEDILLQYRSQHGKCWWCAKTVGSKYHVDHVRPLTRGGSDNPNNLVISCPFCNRSKKDKLPHEWDGRMF